MDHDVSNAKLKKDLEDMESENSKLNFNLCALLLNRDTNRGGAEVPKVEPTKSLEDFKGRKFPTSVGVSTFTLARQLSRWYWSKKGSCYGVVLFAAQGIVPVAAVAFFGQAAGEMQEPNRKDVGSLCMWAGLMYACYMLDVFLGWMSLRFMGGVGLQEELIPLIDRKALKMRGEMAAEWNATRMTSIISNIVNNSRVASLYGATTYVLTTQFVTIVLVIASNFWHLRDLPIAAAICSGFMATDFLIKILNLSRQAKIGAKIAEAAHKSDGWYQEFLQSRFRRGREGDEETAEEKLMMRGFYAINAKITQKDNYAGAGIFFSQHVHYLLHFAIVVAGGIFVLDGKIKLQDYAAVVASIGVAGRVGHAVVAEVAAVNAAKDPIKAIVTFLNAEEKNAQAV